MMYDMRLMRIPRSKRYRVLAGVAALGTLTAAIIAVQVSITARATPPPDVVPADRLESVSSEDLLESGLVLSKPRPEDVPIVGRAAAERAALEASHGGTVREAIFTTMARPWSPGDEQRLWIVVIDDSGVGIPGPASTILWSLVFVDPDNGEALSTLVRSKRVPGSEPYPGLHPTPNQTR